MTLVVRPTSVVTINGEETPFTEWHTQHSVEAGIGQATVTIPRPIPSHVFHGARILITAANDTGDDQVSCFVGQIRGPVNDELGESDATTTIRADGPLWKLSLPARADFAWVGPITPRKLLKQLLLFWGVPHSKSKVEQFVHATTGVPLLLGGIPWFDDGRIIITRGSSPYALADRISRLFGYRIYDRPDGTIRVSRVNGRPPSAAHGITEGEDILSCSRDIDLHDLTTYWEAVGASGSDLAGQAVEVRSVPKRGIKSKFVPNPPKFIAGEISDSLLVTYPLASASRVAKEKDTAGITWNVRAELTDAPARVANLAPRTAFTATVPDLDISGTRYWQIGIGQDFTASGYWATITGWRPRGKHAKEGRIRPAEDVDDPEDPWESDADVKTAPEGSDLDTPDAAAEDFDGSGEDLPAAWDLDNDEAYVVEEDPDYDAENPDGFLDTPPEEGPFDICSPAAVCRRCDTIPLDEPSWQWVVSDLPTWTFTSSVDADAITISGESIGGGETLSLYDDADALLASDTVPVTDPLDGWVPFTVPLAAVLAAGSDYTVAATP